MQRGSNRTQPSVNMRLKPKLGICARARVRNALRAGAYLYPSGENLLTPIPPPESVADLAVAITWRWGRVADRWATNPAATRAINDAFAELKEIVKELTGVPWFENDRIGARSA